MRLRIKKDTRRKQFVVADLRKSDGLMATNCIFKALELIGIYSSCSDAEQKSQFHMIYAQKYNKKSLYYRNRGIDVIYNEINAESNEFFISKRSMRRTGISFRKARVYEGTYIIVKKIIDFIYKNGDLKPIYDVHIRNTEIDKYLTFQYDCMNKYICTKRNLKSRVLAKMESNIEEKIKQ